VLTSRPAEHDLLSLWRLSASWEPAYRWKATAGWQHSSRTSNQPGFAFSEQSLSASIQYQWD